MSCADNWGWTSKPQRREPIAAKARVASSARCASSADREFAFRRSDQFFNAASYIALALGSSATFARPAASAASDRAQSERKIALRGSSCDRVDEIISASWKDCTASNGSLRAKAEFPAANRERPQ